MKIGTRGSKLALAQADKVCGLLREKGNTAEVVVIKTSGDVHTTEPLHTMTGGVGAFVREIDEFLLKGEVDAAVHSLKDVPTKRPDKIVMAAVLKRESALDVAITRDGSKLSELKDGSVVGTSSTRRTALMRKYYPGLATMNIRGNVDTRLRKLRDGEYDAILLAEAGLIRLGLDVRAERIITAAMDGGCVVPMGAYAKRSGDRLDVVCEVLSLDGKRQARVREWIPVEGHEAHALRLAEKLAAAGGRGLIEAAKLQLRGCGDER